ncbi:MAG: hypothetical protein D6772_12605 [Bacteroidetes bacterium]|nr:MAG: hypothetical protein D6772_12605 [Bacteroidota bacterium]
MKHWPKILVLVGSLLGFASWSWGQDTVPGQDAFSVRPLDELLADALAYSPVLKAQEIDVAQLQVELDLLKEEWSNYVALSGTFQVGNLQFIDNLSGPNAPLVQNVSRENMLAVAGLTIRLPLSDFVTRAERRKIIELEVEQERLNLQQRQLEIRELVIRNYHALQSAVRVLEIRTRDLNFHTANTEKAERFFREGSISLEEYTNAYSKRNEAEVRLEEAKVEAQLSYLLLRELVGKEIKR